MYEDLKLTNEEQELVAAGSVQDGDYLAILLAGNSGRVTGKLIRVFAGEGQSDGLLAVLVETVDDRQLIRPTLMHLYERHIVMLFKLPVEEDVEPEGGL